MKSKKQMFAMRFAICKYVFCLLFITSFFAPLGFIYAQSSEPITTPKTNPVSTLNSCNYLQHSLKIGAVNDSNEVKKLQQFFKDYEGFESLAITGIFDQPTLNAVLSFQKKYSEDVLKPWGYSEPTGFVYLLTKKKINEIVCGGKILLTDLENQEIKTYRVAFLANLEKQKAVPTKTNTKNTTATAPATSTARLIEDLVIATGAPSGRGSVDDVNKLFKSNETVVNQKIFNVVNFFANSSNIKRFTASIFSFPHGNDLFEAIVLFIICILLFNVVSTYIGQRTKVFLIGSILAIVGVSLFNREYLIIPFVIVLVIFGVSFLKSFYKKDSQIPSSLILPMQVSAPMLEMMEENASTPEFTAEDVKAITQMVEQQTKN